MVETDGARSLDLERGLFEQSRVPTIILDLEAREILAANAAMEALIGQPREQIIGRPAADFLAAETSDQALRRRGLRQEFTRTVRDIRTVDGPYTCEVLMAPSGVDAVVYVQLHRLDDLLDDDRIATLRERGGADSDRVFDSLPTATLIAAFGKSLYLPTFSRTIPWNCMSSSVQVRRLSLDKNHPPHLQREWVSVMISCTRNFLKFSGEQISAMMLVLFVS